MKKKNRKEKIETKYFERKKEDNEEKKGENEKIEETIDEIKIYNKRRIKRKISKKSKKMKNSKYEKTKWYILEKNEN